MKKAKVGLIAALAGVIGYATGILTAPKSGKETRQDIKQKTSDARVASEKELKKLQEEMSKLIAKAEAKADSLKVKTASDRKKIIDNANKAKAKAGEVIEAIKTKEVKDPDLSKAVEELKNAKDNLAKFIKN